MIAPNRQDPIYNILIVDDDPAVLDTITRGLASLPLRLFTATDCTEGRRHLYTQQNIAIILCDHLLPDQTGVEFLDSLKVEFPHAVRMLMTGANDSDIPHQAINSAEIYRFLSKPFSETELLAAMRQGIEHFLLLRENQNLQDRLARQNQELLSLNAELQRRVLYESDSKIELHTELHHWRKACQGSIDLCLEILQRVDPDLFRHCQRVARLSNALAERMNLESQEREKIELAAQLHDIGLLGNSPFHQSYQRQLSKITDPQDRETVLAHPELSSSLARFLPIPEVLEIISRHHEYLDGSGYPGHLTSNALPLSVRILSVADTFEDLHGSVEMRMEQIRRNFTRQLDPQIVTVFLKLPSTQPALFEEGREVQISHLVPGQKLSNSVYSSNGHLLVRQGQSLTDTLITRLQKYHENHPITQTLYLETPL